MYEPVIGERKDHFDAILAGSRDDAIKALQALRAVVQDVLSTVPYLREYYKHIYKAR